MTNPRTPEALECEVRPETGDSAHGLEVPCADTEPRPKEAVSGHDTGSAHLPLQTRIAEAASGVPRPRKRIAILSPVAWRTPPRQYGAWETVGGNIAEGLVSRGWDVTLFAPKTR